MSETRDAARRWAAVWESAWREHHAESLREVYAEGCTFRSHPFRDPREGVDAVLAYAQWAFDSERSAEPHFGDPIVDGDRAVVEYRAEVVSNGGAQETIAGASFLRFDPDGKVAEQHDYWSASTEAPASPPA